MSFCHCATTSAVSLNELVVGRHLHQKRSQAEVAISQIPCDGREEPHMELFVVSNATEAEARSKQAEILGLQSNRVRDGRFPLPSLSVEPEDPRCSGVCVVDPVNDFVQDFDPRPI